MDLKGAVDFVKGWREAEKIPGDDRLTKEQLTKFAQDLQKKVDEFSVKPERVAWGQYGAATPQKWDADARPIPYSGSAGQEPGWKMAKAMSESGGGKVFYISDTPAGQLLNAGRFRDAVAATAGGRDEKAGVELAKQLIDGPVNADKTRSRYAVDNVPAINDQVSDKLMRQAAQGDVRTITPAAEKDKVFVATELPALLQTPRVTAINGIPKEELLKTLKETGSLEEVNRKVAKASAELLDGTRYTLTADKTAIAAVDGNKLMAGSGVKVPELPPGEADVKVLAVKIHSRSEIKDLAAAQPSATQAAQPADVSDRKDRAAATTAAGTPVRDPSKVAEAAAEQPARTAAKEQRPAEPGAGARPAAEQSGHVPPAQSGRAQAFAQEAPGEAVRRHPELAGTYAAVAAVEKRTVADGLTPEQRAIVMERVRANAQQSIEHGRVPEVKVRDQVEVRAERKEERKDERQLSR
ncbi:hypothetical protein [Pseudoduganella chitinolytica]|uniref:DUF3945 domain-containing protein n=1 Tax=Pseudoduganella chitinolytica TaxID=34070 RepID=A0ABY8BAX1_9BURK|nr:hypothetical protein [Pseudoduganella chitinolytica]WEF31494.1 hypothetical protein PX653_18785 [Pseudoduganella chitinolytica]